MSRPISRRVSSAVFGFGTNMKVTLLAPTLALLTAVSLSAQDAKEAKKAEGESMWLTDFAAAKAQAKKQGVDILMDFTGSDWCGWCIKLREEVFDKDEFKSEIGKHFVLLELDYPQKKKLPEALTAQNTELQAAFAVQGFPTIMLVDAEGKPFAQTGYQPGGPKSYLEHLAKLGEKRVARDMEFAKASKLAGVEKAKALAQALDTLEKNHRAHYGDVMDQICELDKDNKAGLKEKIGQEQADIAMAMKVRGFEGEMMKHFQGGDLKPVGALADKFVAEEKPEGENLQQVLFIKTMALANLKDFAAAAESAKLAIEAAPQGERSAMLKRALTQFEANAKKAAGEKAEKPEKDAKKDGKGEKK